MPLPTIVLVPGIWVGPKIYETVAAQLHTQGFDTVTIPLQSTGRPSPTPTNGITGSAPSIHDDEAFIRSQLLRFVEEEEKEVMLVLHSAGGFLGMAAVQGLTRLERQGRKGGVVGYVFLAAAIIDVGHVHNDLPFFDVNTSTGETHPLDPTALFFNDMDEESTARWLRELKCQPATGWGLTTNYAGYKDAPSVYLVCERDQAVPLEWQETMVELAGCRVVRCQSGHMPMLSMPEKVVEVIVDAAKEFVG